MGQSVYRAVLSFSALWQGNNLQLCSAGSAIPLVMPAEVSPNGTRLLVCTTHTGQCQHATATYSLERWRSDCQRCLANPPISRNCMLSLYKELKLKKHLFLKTHKVGRVNNRLPVGPARLVGLVEAMELAWEPQTISLSYLCLF